MALFELLTGRDAAALARFREHILPVVSLGEALTDAPAMLWWLAGSTP